MKETEYSFMQVAVLEIRGILLTNIFMSFNVECLDYVMTVCCRSIYLLCRKFSVKVGHCIGGMKTVKSGKYRRS